VARSSNANECIDSDPSESSEDDDDVGKFNVDNSDVDSNEDVVHDHKDHTTDDSDDEDNYNEVNGFQCVGAYNNDITNNNLHPPTGSHPAAAQAFGSTPNFQEDLTDLVHLELGNLLNNIGAPLHPFHDIHEFAANAQA
jgi:hypothetical protein